MSTSIPIEAAKHVCEMYDCRHVIILAWDGESTHVVTYGESAEDSDIAAESANYIKKIWGWPKETLMESPKVQNLKDEIDRLKNRVRELIEYDSRNSSCYDKCGNRAPEVGDL